MRFKTGFRRWIAPAQPIAQRLFGFTLVGLSLTRLLLSHRRQEVLWGMSFMMLGWLGGVSTCWPQYYETRGDGLFIRQGWRRFLVPYGELTRVVSASCVLSAADFLTDRVAVGVSDGRLFMIAPVDQAEFFDALAARAPQLERRTGGLQVPLAGLSAI